MTPVTGKVLVAVDGASGGRDAIALARVLAPPSARMVLTNVYGVGADSDAEPTRPSVLAGRALHRLARKESAELLVVGSSHRGPTGRTMLGGQTLAALNGSSCAVAIAPRGYGMAEPQVRTVGVGDAGTAESELAIRTARELAERHGAALEVRAVTDGDPAEELATLAEHLDLLVLGSRAYGPSGRLLSGTTSMQLARRAACPLLVVPRP
ncbi:MAG TPA: universal stress protein [Solirubrobacteraceae bacterium]|jgi:nucleotide-binding universal stress UspA family protein|nr:universal stress protein [Solirubrobacteraceae bacterium]